MKPSLIWTPHQYGGGYDATLTQGLHLSVSMSMTRNDPAPYSFAGLGIRAKARFKTSEEAMIAAELYAYKALQTALAKLPSQ